MSERRHTKIIKEGDFIAEVQVDWHDPSGPWGPHLSLEDAGKLDRVRLALRSGDVSAAQKIARLYRIVPLTGEPLSAAK